MLPYISSNARVYEGITPLMLPYISFNPNQ